jgi:hypothetical protein
VALLKLSRVGNLLLSCRVSRGWFRGDKMRLICFGLGSGCGKGSLRVGLIAGSCTSAFFFDLIVIIVFYFL